MTKRAFTTAQDEQIAQLYGAGQTIRQIATRFEVSIHPVQRALKRCSVVMRKGGRSLPLLHDAFDVVSDDVAYWCGFLFADGSVMLRPPKSPVISVGLAAPDREHLVKLRDFLGSGHAITDIAPHAYGDYVTQPACMLRVVSTQLADRLLSMGRYEGPVAAELASSRHFWRGVVDGDGYLMPGQPRIGLVGAERILNAFNTFLVSNGEPPRSVRPHKSIHAVAASSGPARRIVALLYDDAPLSLDRKGVRARAILSAA